MIKVAIYARVSTQEQETDNQIIQLTEYCTRKGYEIAGTYIDIISGKENSRPNYDLMFKEAHQGLFDLVLFWDLSRFSRAGTLYTLQKLKELENLGINWESYQEPYFSSMGQFKDVVLAVISTVAKMEREKISERTKAGLNRLKREGKTLGRPKGSMDNLPRNKMGYFKRWEGKKRVGIKTRTLLIKKNIKKRVK